CRGPVSLIPRKRTPVVTGIGTPLRITVLLATVNGFQGLLIGTLIPVPLNPTVVPGILNGSGVNGTAAREESKNDRAILKSVNIVRYLSHISRVNEPQKFWRSAGGSAGVNAAKLKAL